MATIKPLLSTVVSKQLPEFIREDYQTFVAFMEAYYEFLDQSQNRTLEEIKDLDRTLDAFVDKVKAELDYAGKYYNGVDERFLLQRIKDIYLAKGSEASYKLMLRLLFNKEATIFYPGEFLLKPSDGKWKQDVSIYVIPQTGDVYDLVGQKATINTPTTKIKAVVSRVRSTPYAGVFEVFLEKLPAGDIPPTSIVSLDTRFVGQVGKSTVAYEVYKGGLGFKAGQLFDITSGLGDGTKIKIASVDSTGAIQTIQFLKFGYNFNEDFIQTINAKTAEIKPFAPYTDYTNGFVDSGYVTKNDYYEDGYINPSYIGKVLREFYNDSSVTKADATDAIIIFKIGGKLKYPGYFETNSGFLSDSIYLQDSKYYQIFSYVIKINEQLSNYKDFIKRYLHPAGMALFAEYEITTNINVTASIKFALNFLKTVIIDTISISNETTVFSITKAFADALTTSDLAALLISKTFSDSVSESDAYSIDVGKNFDETLTITDIATISLVFIRQFDDLFSLTDSYSIATTKVLTDLISEDDSGFSLLTTKVLSDSFTNTDAAAIETDKVLAESFALSDAINAVLAYGILPTDSFTPADGTLSLSTTKVLTDLISEDDSNIVFSTTKALADSFTNTDAAAIETDKVLADSFPLTDSINATLAYAVNPTDTVATDDSGISFSVTTALNDLVATLEGITVALNATKYIDDTQSIADTGGTIVFNYYTTSDYWNGSYSVGATTFT